MLSRLGLLDQYNQSSFCVNNLLVSPIMPILIKDNVSTTLLGKPAWNCSQNHRVAQVRNSEAIHDSASWSSGFNWASTPLKYSDSSFYLLLNVWTPENMYSPCGVRDLSLSEEVGVPYTLIISVKTVQESGCMGVLLTEARLEGPHTCTFSLCFCWTEL